MQQHPKTNTQRGSMSRDQLFFLKRKVIARMTAHLEDLYHDLLACNKECGGDQVFHRPSILKCPTNQKDCPRYVENAEFHFINDILRLAELGTFTVEDAVIAYFPLYVEQQAHIH